MRNLTADEVTIIEAAIISEVITIKELTEKALTESFPADLIIYIGKCVFAADPAYRRDDLKALGKLISDYEAALEA